MPNIDITRLIEAYYKGTLKGEDKAYFKQLMREDPAFKQEVKEYKHIFQGFEALHLEQFQSQLSNMESKYATSQADATPTAVVRPMRRWYRVAVAAAILMVATVAYNLFQPSLYDQHFAAVPSIAVHMESMRASGTLSQTEQIKKQAFAAYQQEDFKRCVILLNDYKNNYAEAALKDYQSLLVLGVAQAAEGQYKKAIANLELVKQSKSSSFKQEAEWIWALVQLKLGHTEVTKSALERIAAQPKHTRHEKANVLLEQL